MKFVQKTKFFLAGVAASAVFVTGVAKAVIEFPTYFKEGDIISAEAFNKLFKNIDEQLDGFTSSDDVLGSWECTSQSVAGMNPPSAAENLANGWSYSGNSFLMTITQRVEFSKVNGEYWMQAEKVPVVIPRFFGTTHAPRLINRYALSDNILHARYAYDTANPNYPSALAGDNLPIKRMSNGTFSMGGDTSYRTNCKRIADVAKINPLK